MVNPMDDLERLFRGLVQVITETSPARITAPFQVSELYQSILPYRAYRRQLEFESSEDYDMAVLRLLAGERNYASVEPAEVMQQLALEAESINPMPGLYRDFAAARVTLNVAALGAMKGDASDYAPPEMRGDRGADEDVRQGPPPQARPDESTRLVFEAVGPDLAAGSSSETTCHSCARTLPVGRRVLYCPFCGSQLGTAVCSNCGEMLERGWKYCITCGGMPHTG